MCIICNTGLLGVEFLEAFTESQTAMKLAADKLLIASKSTHISKDLRKRYDQEHKKMVRLIRTWNSIEHSRERPHISEEIIT